MCDEVEHVKRMFSQIPPDYGKINDLLQKGAFSQKELAAIAVDVAVGCCCENLDALDCTVNDVTPDTMHSSYLLQSLRLLLDNGLNPNECSDGDSVLWQMQWVDAPGVAAAKMTGENTYATPRASQRRFFFA